MENTTTTGSENRLLDNAKIQLGEDMSARGMGAIIWNLREAGFHYLPEVTVTGKHGTKTLRVTGLRWENNTLYAIEEGVKKADISNFYTDGVDVPPVVVTLTPSVADVELGNPTRQEGYTTEGSTEEWLAIADCYFEALNEKNPS